MVQTNCTNWQKAGLFKHHSSTEPLLSCLQLYLYFLILNLLFPVDFLINLQACPLLRLLAAHPDLGSFL